MTLINANEVCLDMEELKTVMGLHLTKRERNIAFAAVQIAKEKAKRYYVPDQYIQCMEINEREYSPISANN